VDNEVIKESIKALEKDMVTAQNKVRKLERALDAIRLLCPHDEHPTGHGHNYTVYECSICGRETHW